jgi:RNA polymerase sigma factor (sigma-70 family)
MGLQMQQRSMDAHDWTALSGRLQRSALALTGSHADADDLTQQTLATLLARRPDKVSHVGYARTTMLRLWLDRQRSLRRRLGRLGRLATGLEPWHVDRDDSGVHEETVRMQEALGKLPPRQRAVIVLRLVEELDYAQIAETLQCSVGAVRSTLHLARARLRDALGEPT